MVPAIEFVAKQVPGMDKLPQVIGELIQKPRAAVETQIEKFAGALLDRALKALGLSKEAAAGLVTKPIKWEVGGEKHQLRIITDGKGVRVQIASNFEDAATRLNEYQQNANQKHVDIGRLFNQATKLIGQVIEAARQYQGLVAQGNAQATEALRKDLLTKVETASNKLTGVVKAIQELLDATPTVGQPQNASELTKELRGIAQEAFAAIEEAASEGISFVRRGGIKLKTGTEARGPVLTVVKDLVTGQVFYGQNQGKVPTILHPLLQERLSEYLASGNPDWTRAIGRAGSHSEVVALNQALLARPTGNLGSFALYNIRIQDLARSSAGSPIPRCKACLALTQGVLALTD